MGMKVIFGAALWLAVPTAASAMSGNEFDKSCMQKHCVAGTKVRIVADKHDPVLLCPTLGLANYTSTVMGMVFIAKTMGGEMPDISPETGEPQFKGETMALIADARHKAGVKTFPEAYAQCAVAKSRGGLTVFNNADDRFIWIGTEKANFWTLKTSVQPQ